MLMGSARAAFRCSPGSRRAKCAAPKCLKLMQTGTPALSYG